jgi:cobalt-zinc-cadmium efflux system protein
MGWAAVLIGSAVMMIRDLPIIDPILALLISAFVLWNVFRNLKKVAMVFLQSAPPGFDVEDLERKLKEVPNVLNAQHTHTWTLDGESHVLSTHLVMNRRSTRDDIVAAKSRVYELLRDQHFEHVTVKVEIEGEICAAETDHSA